MSTSKVALAVLIALIALSGRAIGNDEKDAMVEEEEEMENLNDETIGADAKKVDDDVVVDDEEDDGQLRPSPNAVTNFLFVEPPNSPELFSGKLARFLVGLENVGSEDFVVQTVDASLRYPGDYSYVVHNYTAQKYDYLLTPKSEAAFHYAFMPFDSLAGRPFLLLVKLNYKQSSGKQFSSAVYNGTIFVTEEVSNFDAETLFLYAVVACFLLLLAALLYQFVRSKKRKLGLSKRSPIELGTSHSADVDLEWIPKSALLLNAQKTPRQRKAGRAKTAGEG